MAWTRWAALMGEGRLREEFELQVIGEERLAGLLEDGTIRTAAALFEDARRP
jgi:hypothetical protein